MRMRDWSSDVCSSDLFLRYARGHGCLPCRILTLASSEHLAHDDFRNILAGDASLRHRGFYGDAAQFMSGSGSESAEEAADRCALGSGADDVGPETGLQHINLSAGSRLSMAGCLQKHFRHRLQKPWS